MKTPSPLFVWKLILVVIVVSVSTMYFVDPMGSVFKRRDRKIQNRFDGVHFENDELGIIFFGNSLMNNALPRRERFLNAQLTNEFRKVGILSPVDAREISGGGVTLTNLNFLADRLISIRPSVVIIQSEMLVPRSGNTNPNRPITARVGLWSGVAGLLLFGETRPPFVRRAVPQRQVIEKDISTFRKEMKKKAERRRANPIQAAKEVWADQVVSTNHREFTAGRELIRRLAAHRIRVMIVELPVSQMAVTLSSHDYFQKRSMAIQSVLRPRVSHFVFPRTLPDNYFLDYSHVTVKGRDEFVEWFFPLLAQELAKYER